MTQKVVKEVVQNIHTGEVSDLVYAAVGNTVVSAQ